MLAKYMTIILGKDNPFELRFKIKNTPVARLWADRMLERTAWPMDNPDRFYGFGTPAEERDRAIAMIQDCIRTINNHKHIIEGEFEFSQDYLNYLHHIFEVYHGLLDQQNSNYWQAAPEPVRQALANLNLAVHRGESVQTGLKPRFVCTWFGMPKHHRLDADLQRLYGVQKIQFGTVYLNYCEIGKTAEDLAHDNDKYIGDDAFKPFSHYSADFNVAFYDRDLSEIYDCVQNYIDQHQDFFVAHDIKSVYNIKAQPLRFPLADLEFNGNQQKLLVEIAQRQWVQQVILE